MSWRAGALTAQRPARTVSEYSTQQMLQRMHQVRWDVLSRNDMDNLRRPCLDIGLGTCWVGVCLYADNDTCVCNFRRFWISVQRMTASIYSEAVQQFDDVSCPNILLCFTSLCSESCNIGIPASPLAPIVDFQLCSRTAPSWRMRISAHSTFSI